MVSPSRLRKAKRDRVWRPPRPGSHFRCSETGSSQRRECSLHGQRWLEIEFRFDPALGRGAAAPEGLHRLSGLSPLSAGSDGDGNGRRYPPGYPFHPVPRGSVGNRSQPLGDQWGQFGRPSQPHDRHPRRSRRPGGPGPGGTGKQRGAGGGSLFSGNGLAQPRRLHPESRRRRATDRFCEGLWSGRGRSSGVEENRARGISDLPRHFRPAPGAHPSWRRRPPRSR